MRPLKITVSVEMKIAKPFVFRSCNLSAFICQLQRLHIWALCHFFGQEDHCVPSSKVPERLWQQAKVKWVIFNNYFMK